MNLNEFDFNLPQNLIAQFPTKPRDCCRLLVLDRKNQRIYHDKFLNLSNYLEKSDFLVFNNSKVISSRFFGKKEDTEKIFEVLLLRKIKENIWEALIKNSKKIKIGQRIFITPKFYFKLLKKVNEKTIIKAYSKNFKKDFKTYGHIPLPPYIKRLDLKNDKKDYQTIFAKKEGSIAAPTASLHFTSRLLKKLKKNGINFDFVTLHVGLGTFQPIRTKKIEEHKIEAEFYYIPQKTLKKIKETKKKGRSVVAVGTTVVRTLENYALNKKIKDFANIFIYPPFKFKITDKLITNFHLPKSSLLLLVSAFGGKELILKAYKEAIKNNYRFYSYGDAMLII